MEHRFLQVDVVGSPLKSPSGLICLTTNGQIWAINPASGRNRRIGRCWPAIQRRRKSYPQRRAGVEAMKVLSFSFRFRRHQRLPRRRPLRRLPHTTTSPHCRIDGTNYASSYSIIGLARVASVCYFTLVCVMYTNSTHTLHAQEDQALEISDPPLIDQQPFDLITLKPAAVAAASRSRRCHSPIDKFRLARPTLKSLRTSSCSRLVMRGATRSYGAILSASNFTNNGSMKKLSRNSNQATSSKPS